jgi:hypothetical protein
MGGHLSGYSPSLEGGIDVRAVATGHAGNQRVGRRVDVYEFGMGNDSVRSWVAVFVQEIAGYIFVVRAAEGRQFRFYGLGFFQHLGHFFGPLGGAIYDSHPISFFIGLKAANR